MPCCSSCPPGSTSGAFGCTERDRFHFCRQLARHEQCAYVHARRHLAEPVPVPQIGQDHLIGHRVDVVGVPPRRQIGLAAAQIRLVGPRSYGTLTLKRGMTASFDLWDWFGATLRDPSLRGSATIVLFAPNGQTQRARFVLTRCLPVKLKAPPLNAKDGMVAIEEFQLAYETLALDRSE